MSDPTVPFAAIPPVPPGPPRLGNARAGWLVIAGVAAAVLLCCGVAVAAIGHGGSSSPTTTAAHPTATHTIPANATATVGKSAVTATSVPPTATPKPAPPTATPRPPTATPKPVPPTATPNTCGAPPNPYGYSFCGGRTITAPPADFCSYFPCITTFWNGTGYVVECQDGDYSLSGGHQGVCSYHNGFLRNLYMP